MAEARLRSPLAKFAPLMRDPDPKGALSAAKRLWHEHGIVVVFPDQFRGLERDLIETVAAKHYGKRGK